MGELQLFSPLKPSGACLTSCEHLQARETAYFNDTKAQKKLNLIVWAKIVVFFLLVAAGLGAGVYWVKSRVAEHGFTDDPSTRQFIIGNDVLEIPLNLMRLESQRQQTVLKQADLVMFAGDGSGYSNDNAGAFLRADRVQDLIFVTLVEREMHLEMSDRLQPIYAKLLSATSQAGPGKLILRPFRPGTGYDGEELAISPPDGDRQWVARCQLSDDSQYPNCMRDFFVGSGLTLRFRFARALLPQWRAVEALVRGRMAGIVTTGQ
jgi:hypothetical protein